MQQPMGSYLRDLEPYSINITANAGEFWGCGPQCAPVGVYGAGAQSGPSDYPSYHFELVLPRFSVARFLK